MAHAAATSIYKLPLAHRRIERELRNGKPLMARLLTNSRTVDHADISTPCTGLAQYLPFVHVMKENATPRGPRLLTHTPSDWRFALLFVASLTGCGGVVGSGPPQPPPTTISITLTPVTASVPLGGTASFSATVANASDTGVTWTVNGVPGGNATVGTIDASGAYTAPQILPAPPSVTVAATSAADPSESASAAVAITSSFSLAVAGPSSVNTGASADYTATFAPDAGSNPSRASTWSIAGTGCAASACGTISASGVYTAPPVPPPGAAVQIIATPQADPSKAASISVAIVPAITVSISPSAATVPLGATRSFQATVTGAQDATVTWCVNGVAGGSAATGSILNSQTNPNSTTYTAPLGMPTGGSVTIEAQSNANPRISAAATITFSTTVNVTLTPASASLAINESQTFTALVNNTPNQGVAWAVNGIAGGNSAMGQICAQGSSPCQPVWTTNGGSVSYVAPAGVPSPDPVTITATSQANSAQGASASVAILPHIVVSIQPVNATLAGTEQFRFTASVTGTQNQQALWSVGGDGCGNPGACGSIDSTGLYTAPAAAPTPNLINVTATSAEDSTQSATAIVTIASGPAIFSIAPTSAYAGSIGGFTLLVSGYNFAPGVPGPASTIRVAGTPRTSSCVSNTQCITSLGAADLQIAGNLSVQVQNPDGSLSNTQTFVVLAPGSGSGIITLTPGAPASSGNDIVVVELSTNGGSGAPGNVSLAIGAIGPYSEATSACTLGASPAIVQPPPSGTGTADVCVFSLSALDPSFTYTITGPPTPDVSISNREPLGLGMLHLTLQVPAAAAAGPRTLFVENAEKDTAAGTGSIEIQ